MTKIIYISNGQKTLRCSEGQLEAFTSQTDGEGKPVWTVVPDPNPPKLSEAEVALNDHTNQIAITHVESGKQSWCDKGQLEGMLATGWKKSNGKEKAPDTPAEDPKPVVEDPKPVVEDPKPVVDSPLRKVLEGLDPLNDGLWKANGEVNITSLRDFVPNVTRKEVEDAFPGFNRTSPQG